MEKRNAEDLNRDIFVLLFKEACEKCFGFPLTSVLTETDSRLFSSKVFEHTGLVIGARTVKNYSFFVFHEKETKKENPSVATLDTLARYVLDAPYTDEIQRRNNESHYPYWFQYRSRHVQPHPLQKWISGKLKRNVFVALILLVAATGIVTIDLSQKRKARNFSDNFSSLSDDSLAQRGWIVKSRDANWWNKRNEKPGSLSLYTIKGDNWPNAENPAGIRNLLMRKISTGCFMVEIRLSDFIPRQNWQQAGILLSEDSTWGSKALRFSVSYNDYFGGYKKPPEIIIQAICSSENDRLSKPEEIAQIPLFSFEKGMDTLVRNNLKRIALKIEKKKNRFRLLYTVGSVESFAFKEVVSKELDLNPKFVGLFAIRGWANEGDAIPVHFDSFIFTRIACDK